MTVMWADECDAGRGAVPRPDLWGTRETDRWQPAAELQRYTRDPRNAHYDGDGHLVLTALRTPEGFTSARLSARHGGLGSTFRYGLFEARVKVPTGAGVWPAFWLLGPDDTHGWPECGEVDVMEAPASAATAGQVHQGTHSPRAATPRDPAGGDAAVALGVTPVSGDWGADFHTYAVIWSPGRMDFMIDGRPTGSVTAAGVAARGGRWVFDERPLAPILNVAVGGWAGTPDGSWQRQSMLVDWVRVHDLPDPDGR
jgi:beta-glucanase (GH16 family)